MTKQETLAFQKIPLDSQTRFEDRISFVYLEYSKIVQSDSGVMALSENVENNTQKRTEIQIPVGGIALLQLGPGTSITNAALTSCARSGCVVQFTGGGGFPENSTIIPYSSTSKYAIAQAMIVSDNAKAKKVAKIFYNKQFGESDSMIGSITQMRGIEGSIMRKVYRHEANIQKLKGWRRQTDSDDSVNVALNIANSILYGLCAGFVQALGMNPALGIIHRGNTKSLLFDLGDLYKPRYVVPAMFRLAHTPLEKVPQEARRSLREIVYNRKIMKDLPKFIIKVFSEYAPENNQDRLIGTSQEVEAHINYGGENVHCPTS